MTVSLERETAGGPGAHGGARTVSTMDKVSLSGLSAVARTCFLMDVAELNSETTANVLS